MTYRSTFGRISRPTPLLFALLIMAAAAAPGAKAATYPAGFEERALVGSLTGPTAVAWTPDGRMLVAEKAGKLKVVAPGATTATQILDISAKVNCWASPWTRASSPTATSTCSTPTSSRPPDPIRAVRWSRG